MKTTYSCTTCGSNFEEWPSQVPPLPYCSKQCWYLSIRKSLTGAKIGRYLVGERKRENGETRYLCKCECGTVKWVPHSNLKTGHRKGFISCGCLQKEMLSARTRKPTGDSIKRSVWNYYKRNAKTRGYEWLLSYDVFAKLIMSPCRYCGRTGVTKTPSRWTENESISNNGVDRLDNSVGYTEANSVPCCKTCNFAKSDLSVENFREWIRTLSSHLGKW
jgi:hypothetical protein